MAKVRYRKRRIMPKDWLRDKGVSVSPADQALRDRRVDSSNVCDLCGVVRPCGKHFGVIPTVKTSRSKAYWDAMHADGARIVTGELKDLQREAYLQMLRDVGFRVADFKAMGGNMTWLRQWMVKASAQAAKARVAGDSLSNREV